MKLYLSPRAPNPRRVRAFLAEKGITDLPIEEVDLNAGQHRTPEYLAKSPYAKVPTLVLDDGRGLSESRAICSYLEGLYPEPNLMGRTFEERAFIEMADRQVELYFFMSSAMAIRHLHPGLAVLEGQQFAGYGEVMKGRGRDAAVELDARLARQPWVAGERFTIADITLLCGLDFARGLLKFKSAELGFTHLAAWRERMNERACASVQ
jgi:glutathione S-transferase